MVYICTGIDYCSLDSSVNCSCIIGRSVTLINTYINERQTVGWEEKLARRRYRDEQRGCRLRVSIRSRLYPRLCIIPAENATRRRDKEGKGAHDAVSLKTLPGYNVTRYVTLAGQGIGEQSET